MQRWGMTNAGGNQISINQQHESFDITMMEACNLVPRATLSHNIMEDQQNQASYIEVPEFMIDNKANFQKIMGHGKQGLEIFTGFLEQLTIG